MLQLTYTFCDSTTERSSIELQKKNRKYDDDDDDDLLSGCLRGVGGGGGTCREQNLTADNRRSIKQDNEYTADVNAITFDRSAAKRQRTQTELLSASVVVVATRRLIGDVLCAGNCYVTTGG